MLKSYYKEVYLNFNFFFYILFILTNLMQLKMFYRTETGVTGSDIPASEREKKSSRKAEGTF